ncbi:oligosaccharide repeat unit polymerase [Vibrio parahaemolyticus]|uniref:O-antigen polymerase n=1 Tax=Vibrio parahaemolyticus TaxID=670 RepID=UPI0027E5AF26|nr:O-antigen polymerase [Vibrio parahaemolyticus]WMN68085.1 oligosaccharide repeat unit polymerase [Vibrio parahaemolyticus]
MNILYLFSIYFILFWSLPFLPGTYSAVTPYITAVVGFLFLLKLRSVGFSLVVNLIVIICFTIIYSLYSYLVYGGGYVKTFAYILSVLSFLGYYYFLINNGWDKVRASLIRLSYFVSFILILELIAKIFSLSFLKSIITLIFSGHVTDKIILTTSEPSWAVQVILFCCIFLVYDYSQNRSKVSLLLLIVNLVSFAIIFSMTGVIVLMLSLSFYLIVYSKLSFKEIIKYIFFIMILTFSLFIVYQTLSEGGGYTFNRISKLIGIFDNKSISDFYYGIISIDNSLLVRIGYPIIALNMIVDHPLGLGVNGFAYNLSDYQYLVDTPSLYLSEFPLHVLNNNADTRNFFLSIGVEFGVLGLMLFVLIFRHLTQASKKWIYL